MGVFRQFPYSNFHEMNMDEIIKIVKNMLEEWAQYHAEWDAWMDEINDDWSNYQEVMNEAWQNMQDFINNYFDNLDVQEEINNKITSMVNNGEFATIVEPYIPPRVTAWLEAHITQPVGVVIDDSLTVEGACADAKATGDAVRELQTDIDEALELIWPTNIVNKDALLTGYTINWHTGELLPNNDYCVLGFLRIKPDTTYYSYTGMGFDAREVEAFFYETADEDTFISKSDIGVSFTTPVNCNYVRFPFANTVWDVHGEHLHITPNQYEGYTEYFNPYYSVPVDTNLKSIVNNHTKEIDGTIKPIWEWGGIDNISIPFTYTDSHSRIRMSDNNKIWLSAGSKVGFNSYNNARFFVAGVNKQGNNASTSWNYADYTIQVDGYYQFVLTTYPETILGEMTSLTDNFFIIECESIENLLIAKNNNLLSIAHQGCSSTNEYYGNSRISSFINAKKQYFDYGETDLAFSSDNVPMCCHDLTFIDSDDGETVITISEHTSAELQTYGYYGEHIATLDEVMKTCKKIGLGLVIDKLSRITTDTQWETVFDIVQKYQMQDDVRFCIESEANGIKILDWYSEAKIFYVANDINNTMLTILNNLKTWYNRKNNIDIDVLHTGISDITTAFASIPTDIKLYLWTIDDANTYITKMPYCAGVTSNKISANKLLV